MKYINVHLSGIALLLTFGVGLASAQKPGTEVNTGNGREASNRDAGEQAFTDKIWRCSLDQRFYTVTYSNGLHIRAISSGQLTADIPLTTDKKGNSKLEGHWAGGASGGLIVIQGFESGVISGHMLVPTTGTAALACNSRKASIIYSLGQPQPVCTVESVSWNLLSNVSASQAIQEETQQLNRASDSSAAQPSGVSNIAASSVDSSLIGTWSNETSTAVSYTKTHLELRADGTYTKSFGARPPTMGGGVVGAATFGDTHSGTWSVAGPLLVRLSGDSRHSPYMQDLSLLSRQ